MLVRDLVRRVVNRVRGHPVCRWIGEVLAEIVSPLIAHSSKFASTRNWTPQYGRYSRPSSLGNPLRKRSIPPH